MKEIKKVLILLATQLIYFNSCSEPPNKPKIDDRIHANIAKYDKFNDTALVFNNTNGNSIVVIGYSIDDIISGRKFVACEFKDNGYLPKGELWKRTSLTDRLNGYFNSVNKMQIIYSYVLKEGTSTNISQPNLSIYTK